MPLPAGLSRLAGVDSPSDSISVPFKVEPQQPKVSADQQLAVGSPAALAQVPQVFQVANLEKEFLEGLSVVVQELDATTHAQTAQDQPGLDSGGASFSKARPHLAAISWAHPGGAASKVPDQKEHHQPLRPPLRGGPEQAISRELRAGKDLSWLTLTERTGSPAAPGAEPSLAVIKPFVGRPPFQPCLV